HGDGTATLAGMPTNANAGTLGIALSVSDGTAAPVEQHFSITVAAINHAPKFTSTPVTSATSESPYHYNVTASDADGDTLQIVASSLPSWLTLVDNGNGIATLAGTPTNVNAGSVQITLSVLDGTAAAVQQT